MVTFTRDVRSAAAVIKAGGVVAYPTETVYGIGALALHESAVHKVIALKKMTLKPISLAVSSFDMIDAVAHVEDADLLRRLLPGPVTVLLRKRHNVPDILTAGSPLVGIRYPSHPLACALVQLVEAPITSTSANVTRGQPAMRAEDITIDVDYVLHGEGVCLGPSTVVDLIDRVVVRKGAGYDAVLETMGVLRASEQKR